MINWEVTYAKESPRLLGLCRRYVGDLAQAEDLLHEGFLTAMSKIDQYSGRGAFEGWLRQVVLSTVLQHLRKQKGQPADRDVDTLEVVNEEDEVPTAWEPVAQNLTMDQLLAIVDQLPSHHRAVFNLYVIDGYSHKEIGKMLKISPGTSKSHLARARKKLQQWMLAGAQEEEQKKKKRRRLAFFWFILPGAKFDQAMRDRLEDLTITPQREMPVMQPTPTESDWQFVPKPQGNTWVLVGGMSVAIAGALVIALVVWQPFTKPTPADQPEPPVPEVKSEMPVSDSTQVAEENDIVLEPEEDVPASEGSETEVVHVEPEEGSVATPQVQDTARPVVVRRQVVVQRLVVPDTASEADSTQE